MTKTELSTLASILSIMSVFGCSSMEVNTGHDPSADFSKYKTYAWTSLGRASSGSPPTSLLETTLRTNVSQELSKKGMTEVEESAKPDLLLSFSAITWDNVTYGMTPGPWYWGPAEEAYHTKEGSLTLQFIDPKSNKVVWQGTATEAIPDEGVSQKQIALAVKEIVEKYPQA